MERTKERRPKKKSFRKIAEEIGLAGKDTDERNSRTSGPSPLPRG